MVIYSNHAFSIYNQRLIVNKSLTGHSIVLHLDVIHILED